MSIGRASAVLAAVAGTIAMGTSPANGQLEDVSNWAAFDAGEHEVGNDPDGYDGIVFDGRYVYFSPGFNGTEQHGEVLRYDTQGDFDHTSSWAAYDPGAHGVGLIARGYRGPAFDGRYVYFAPFADSATTVHGEVLRYDTTGDFADFSSWAAYNPSTQGIGYRATGYSDAVFDGRYVYFVPFYNSTGCHGEVLRYDTSMGFSNFSSWVAFDPGAHGVGNTPDGYKSGVFDGRYVYFTPSHTSNGYHGEVLRYDAQGEFDSSDSWDAYDYGTECGADCNDPGGFATAVFDGRYIYFGPGISATGSREVLRYDTTADFSTASSWLTFDPQSQGLGTWATSFAGAVFDGRHIYFMPHVDFDISTEVVLSYDTTASFTDVSSWAVFDPAAAGVGCGIDGHHAGVFDGRYVYFAPTNWNYPELVHGEVLRYDTGQARPVSMEWVTVGDPGNTGEVSGSDAGGTGPTRICGAVDYTYRIGKYEVTNGQYIAFLNAVAGVEDTHELFEAEDPYGHGGMDGEYGGVERIGSPGDYLYIPKGGDTEWLDKPIHFIGFYDALRFANWMHNGQPTGLQDESTTEDGAYDMSLGSNVVRKAGARVFLPNEDEWYKAAYYKGGGTNAGYWNYCMDSDWPPAAEPPPGSPAPPGSANYFGGGEYAVGPPYYATDGGAYTWSPSPYGTFDQCGNMHEWVDTWEEGIGPFLRGSGYPSFDPGHAANHFGYIPEGGIYTHTGFRVASMLGPPAIPAVSHWGLVVMTLLVLTLGTVLIIRPRFGQVRQHAVATRTNN